ncbi:MAG TPA: transglycosylase SLT domain-containing protein [Thermodesulfobacteriota bacterium]|nr:transglycosylase SLT domain-containing protein [Thermodesulfobacteriota bacterium]
MIALLIKRYDLLVSAAIWGLLLQSVVSYSAEIRESNVFSSREENVQEEKKADQSRKDMYSVDFSRTSLNLLLLGTITRGDFGSAIIKDRMSGELGTYSEGDIIDIIRAEQVKLVRISNCVVMLQRGSVYETLSCGSRKTTPYNVASTVNPTIPSPLAKYRIVDSSDKEKYKIVLKPIAPKIDKKVSKAEMVKYERKIQEVSQKHGIDPYLVEAIIKVESNFNPNAVSPKNALGIMQLLPETAKDYGVDDPFDPEANIEGGVKVLKELIDYFNGDVQLALAAYNAGKGAVIKHGFKVPPYVETLEYVEKVLGHYNLLKWSGYN